MNRILKFGAEWCGPCRAISPIVKDLAEQYKDVVEFADYDADVESELCMKYNIISLPTFIFLKGEEVVDIVKGATTKGFLQKKIEQYYV